MDKRKTIDGYIIPENRGEFRFTLKFESKSRDCYTRADTKEQALAMVERTVTEAGWLVEIEEAA